MILWSLFPGKVLNCDHSSWGPGNALDFTNKSPYKGRLIQWCLMSYISFIWRAAYHQNPWYANFLLTCKNVQFSVIHVTEYTIHSLAVLSSSGSANAHLPGCFHPWTFPLNIGLNMLHSDFLMPCWDSLLGYSTGEFQALQLIVPVVFGAVD